MNHSSRWRLKLTDLGLFMHYHSLPVSHLFQSHNHPCSIKMSPVTVFLELFELKLKMNLRLHCLVLKKNMIQICCSTDNVFPLEVKPVNINKYKSEKNWKQFLLSLILDSLSSHYFFLCFKVTWKTFFPHFLSNESVRKGRIKRNITICVFKILIYKHLLEMLIEKNKSKW